MQTTLSFNNLMLFMDDPVIPRIKWKNKIGPHFNTTRGFYRILKQIHQVLNKTEFFAYSITF